MAAAELTESAVLTEASVLMPAGQGEGAKGIWRTLIIAADVQGSSGYYPAEVLKRDGPMAFPAGTHVYLDHPTADEDTDRPERSVRDLAGYLVDGARFEESPEDGRGLFARIQFIDELKDRLKSLAPVIGLSIRASGQVEAGPDGRNIVRSIAKGLSVDVVTRAGAGGRLVTMTESDKPDSPPADNTQVVESEKIPSTAAGTGALRSEVASLRESLSDRIEQLSIDNARMTQVVKESQRLTAKLMEENKTVRESLDFLRERQTAADQALSEAKNVGEVVAVLVEAKLPLPSLIRLAQNYRPGQDIHAAIQGEREYVKKVFRESARGDLSSTEPSGLGLTESSGQQDYGSSISSDDLSEMDSILSGKLY